MPYFISLRRAKRFYGFPHLLHNPSLRQSLFFFFLLAFSTPQCTWLNYLNLDFIEPPSLSSRYILIHNPLYAVIPNATSSFASVSATVSNHRTSASPPSCQPSLSLPGKLLYTTPETSPPTPLCLDSIFLHTHRCFDQLT